MRALVGLILLLVSCGPGSAGPGLDVAAIRAHVDALTQLGPRRGDSDRSRAAAAYIEHALPVPVERVPVGTVRLPEITVAGITHRYAHDVATTDPDLIVRFGPPGPERGGPKYLLLMGHYDTVERSPGAVDNAVAVGTLIELARVLAKEPPSRPVMIAFTANEEIGLVGAEALAERRGGDVDLAIALDLVGGEGDLIQNGASELIGLAEMRWLARAADRAGVTIRAPLAHRVVSRWWPQAERSDHGPFTRRGVRAFHLYNRGQHGEWIDLAYHSERDRLERVDPTSVDHLGRVLRALIAEPLGSWEGDGFWVPIASNTVLPRWVLLAFEALLVAVTVVLLIRARRRRVVGGLGAIAGIACFAAAVGLVVLLERAIGGDHPAPWLHAPLRWLCGEALVLAGVLGLVTRVLARWSAWTGERRYLAIAAIGELVIGCAWLAGGAAELAWIWLVPACALAIAPHLGRFALVGVAITLLPVALVLGPDQVREAAWNGFLPTQLPFVLWIAVLGFPTVAGICWYLRGRRSGPLGTLVLAVGCALIIVVGIAILAVPTSRCSSARFHDFSLACEEQM